MTPLVSIVIVNWNTREPLVRCLRAIRTSLGAIPHEVILVDNASEDGSVEAARECFPGLAIIANPDNRGFAAAVNQGLARGAGGFFLILNPDLFLSPGCLEKLLDVLRSEPRAGMAAPRLVDEAGAAQRGYLRKLPSLGQLFFFSTLLEEWALRSPRLVSRFLEDPRPGAPPLEEVEQLPGACLLISREAVARIGPMDEGFRLFFEDVDWCRRLREAGYKLLLLNEVTTTHLGGRSFARGDSYWMHGRFLTSMLRYFDKHGTLPERWLSKAIALSNSAAAIAARGLQWPFASSAGRDRLRRSLKRHLYFLRELRRSYLRPPSSS